VIRVWVATAFALSALALVGAATAGSSADSDPGGHCAAGDASMRDGQLDQAVDAYLEALRADAACADAKLRAAAAAKRLEARLCAEGDDRAELGKDGEAQRKYVDALNVNVASDCAREGIAARPESKSRGARFFDYLPEFPIHLGSLALMLLVAFALFGLVRSLFLRKASLVIKPFADEAVNPKVGTAFAGLIEEQLVSVWRMRQGLRDDGYILDLVVADVELLSADESLDDAVGELAQVPQFGIVAGLVAFVDRLFIQRRLSAVGDLLPEGDRGCGVALSLFKRKSLQARGTLWERPEAETAPDAAGEPSPVEPKPVLEGVLSFFKRMALEVRRTSWERPEAETAPGVAPASPAVEQKSESETGESPAEAAAEAGTGKGLAASRYYGLAGAAVAWVQYEAARALEARVGVITSSAKSFSLLSAGLDEHRAAAAAAALSAGLDEHRAAAAAAEAETLYRKAERHYRDALEDDGENVAALFNLALFVARHDAKFDDALSRLKAARSILERRYSEVSPARAKPATRRREELADPTWYRIRYALAAQRLHKGDYARAQAAALELIGVDPFPLTPRV